MIATELINNLSIPDNVISSIMSGIIASVVFVFLSYVLMQIYYYCKNIYLRGVWEHSTGKFISSVTTPRFTKIKLNFWNVNKVITEAVSYSGDLEKNTKWSGEININGDMGMGYYKYENNKAWGLHTIFKSSRKLLYVTVEDKGTNNFNKDGQLWMKVEDKKKIKDYDRILKNTNSKLYERA